MLETPLEIKLVLKALHDTHEILALKTAEKILETQTQQTRQEVAMWMEEKWGLTPHVADKKLKVKTGREHVGLGF